MRKRLPLLLAAWIAPPAVASVAAATVVGCGHGVAAAPAAAVGAAAVSAPLLAEEIDAPAALKVTSGEFTDGQPLPAVHAFGGMGCTGHNVPPELSWQGAPAGTRGYAVIMHDPDAPTGVGFFHWLVFDLPGETTRLGGDAGGLPAGARQGLSDFGVPGYGGPCPPPGAAHRYVTTVYALDVARLPVEGHVTGAKLRFLLRGHTLAFGRITGTFQRL